MASLTTLDIYVGLGAIAIAAVAIYLFLRASGGITRSESREEAAEAEKEAVSSPPSTAPTRSDGLKIPEVEHHLDRKDIEGARSKIRTLSLQSELLSTVLKRLFEAEDEGEITREERISLSKGYEAELKRISEELKRSELVVSLHELENIRDEILKKFEETLNSTQSRIDAVLKELKIEEKKEEQRRAPSRRRRRPAKKEEKEEEAPEEAEEEEAKPPKPKSEVEEKLEQLRKEVLKELEELDKLELEA